MQKIIEQRLDGGQEKSNLEAKYTWQENEEAYYFCTTYRDVFKIKFTGNKWLSGNGWGWRKIYQYEFIESSGEHNLKEKGLDRDGKSHDEESVFYTEKQEAIDRGKRYLEGTLKDALDKYENDMIRLSRYELLKTEEENVKNIY